MRYEHILVTLDGSELAEKALDAALRVAVTGAKIHLLSVIDESATMSLPLVSAMNATFPLYYQKHAAPPEFNITREVSTRYEYLNSVKERLTQSGYDVTAEAYVGRVIETILDVASDFDLLVMATHGRTGLSKFMLGSVTEAILHKVSRPILIAPAHTTQPASEYNGAGYDCIVVSLDGSPQSEAILPEVEKLLRIHAGKVVLVRTALYTEFNPAGLVPDASTLLNKAAEQEAHEYLDRIAKRFAALGAKPIVEVNLNAPKDEIRLAAVYYHADLIAMATHARTGFNRLLRGSVTEDVMHQALHPMLIVRTPDV